MSPVDSNIWLEENMLPVFPLGEIIGLFLVHVCLINVILAIFNLIPIPPLDGSRVVIGFLPSHMVSGYLSLERYGFLIIFGLLYLGVLDYILIPIATLLLQLLLWA